MRRSDERWTAARYTRDTVRRYWRDDRGQLSDLGTRRVLTLIVRAVVATAISASCASMRATQPSTAGDGTLTLAITTQRSQPGCPIVVRVQIPSTEPQVVDSKLTWRVAHGSSERRGTFELSFAPEPMPRGDRTAEIEFTPARAGTYDIEARVIYETGRTSVARLRHDVAHRWPFQAPHPCDFEQSPPHEASG